jgi:apolipoprotein N-acyltransferase
VLLAVAALNLLHLGTAALLDLVWPIGFQRLPLWLLVRRVLYLSMVPGVVALVLHLATRARLAVDEAQLSLEKGGVRWHVPRASIVAVVPWRLPWPSPGVDLALASGRRFRYRLALRDPTPLVAALGQPTDAPALRDARARHAARWLRHPLIKFALVPIAPTAIVFRLHEILTAGSWLGEYYMFGLGRWLYTLSGVYFDMLGHLVLWAALLRVAVELVAWPAALLPERAGRRIRLAMEGLGLLAYVLGPTWLLWSRLTD